MASTRKKLGPFSRDQAFSNLDRRTHAGRVWKTVTRELIEQLGDATAAQRLLVQSAAIKAVRMALLIDVLLSGEQPSEGGDHHALAWLNSLRLDLVAIGLERRATPSLDLGAYLKTAVDMPVDVPAEAPEAAD